MEWLKAAFPGRAVHSIATADIQGFLANRGVGKKRLNNLRGDLNAFFAWCQLAPREWTSANPVKPIPKFRILRGVPEIISADVARKLMAFAEAYKSGAMVPYFALCLFAGIRPSFQHGEIRKLADSPDPSKPIDQALGVIRISPDVAKTKSVRQITIQPNLNEAICDNSVACFILDFDIPGGVVTGVPELAAFTRGAAEEKPIYAFTGGQSCSAAYWLASACSKVFCTESADVGSIGVYVALVDETDAWT